MKFLALNTLVLLFSFSAFAGESEGGGFMFPAQQTRNTDNTFNGDSSGGGFFVEVSLKTNASDELLQAAVSLSHGSEKLAYELYSNFDKEIYKLIEENVLVDTNYNTNSNQQIMKKAAIASYLYSRGYGIDEALEISLSLDYNSSIEL